MTSKRRLRPTAPNACAPVFTGDLPPTNHATYSLDPFVE
jgi:hypothetical protein